MADPDWTDPCARAAYLRPLYYKLLAEGGVVRVRAGSRETQYQPADADKLAALLAAAESECAAKQGLTTGRRRAIRFG